MKAIVSKSDLRDALSRVIPAVAIKPSTPVLAGIYLQAENDDLTIRATNFELDITADIPANVEAEGKTVVTGKHFVQITNKLGGEIVTLATTDDNQLTIRSEAASFDILTMDADDFPAPTKLDEGGADFRISRDTLKNLIRRTAFACAAKDSFRPIFMGVNFIVSDTEIKAVATNTTRIAIAKGTTFDPDKVNVIIRAADLRALQSAFSSDSIITCEFDKKYAAFVFEDTRFITRLIDGAFPPADKIIPPTFKTTAEVDKAELLAAVNRIQIIAAEADYRQVMFKFTDDGLELSSNSNSTGKAIEHLDANVSGDDIEIAFNYQYLVDALKTFDSKTIRIGMNEELTPAVFTGEDDEGFVYVATPLRIC